MVSTIMGEHQHGSSPLARGTRERTSQENRQRRFIPACAGNSVSGRSGLRGRGGSSPLARGTLTCKTHLLQTYRFIPACAGNSPAAGRGRIHFTVHPRLRGELISPSMRLNRPRGSSPLARGTHKYQFAGNTSQRFIPACAGNSVIKATIMRILTVHPRLRGELRRYDRS